METVIRDVPPPQPFEVSLARKILYQKATLLHTFLKIDGDQDGVITKDDFKKALQNQFELDLTDEQVDKVFITTCGTADGSIQPIGTPNSRNPLKCGMRYTDFARYINTTASSTRMASNMMNYNSSSFRARANQKLVGIRPSTSHRVKTLRRKVFSIIQQSAPSDMDGGMAATHMFLMMDKMRNNKVTIGEFKHWLGHKKGLVLNDEEMKLLMGKYWKGDDSDGLTLTECVGLHHLLKLEWCDPEEYDDLITLHQEQGQDYDARGDVAKVNSKESQQRDDNDDDGDHDEDNIEPFDENEKKAIQRFRHKLDSSMKNAFKFMASNNLTLSSLELKRGFLKSGVQINDEQIDRIMKVYGGDNLQMEFHHFVKFMSAKM